MITPKFLALTYTLAGFGMAAFSRPVDSILAMLILANIWLAHGDTLRDIRGNDQGGQ